MASKAWSMIDGVDIVSLFFCCLFVSGIMALGVTILLSPVFALLLMDRRK